MNKTDLSRPLPQLAEEINQAYRLAEEAAQSAIAHATHCGTLLLEAKAQMKHGEWLPWLEANCRVGARQAQKWMRIAKNPELANTNPDSHLTIDGALQALAGPDNAVDWGKFGFAMERDGVRVSWGDFNSLASWEDVVAIFDPKHYALFCEAPEDILPPFYEELIALANNKAVPFGWEFYVTALNKLGRCRDAVAAPISMSLFAKRQLARLHLWLQAGNEFDVDAFLERCDRRISELEEARP